MFFLLGFVLFRVCQNLLIFSYCNRGCEESPNSSLLSCSKTLSNFVQMRFKGCCIVDEIGRDDWRGEVYMDVVLVLLSYLLILIGGKRIFPDFYL